jgi:hypothetical protein
MCTVVVRWSPGEPLRLLALRDEVTARDFDDPDAWWPEQPSVVGGRDRTAGGSWCVTDVTTGVTALVLNRFERRQAAAGAPSRGTLPLLGVAHGADWPQALDLAGMASFTLVLAEPQALTTWAFDGLVLTRADLAPGTHMVTSGGAEEGKAERYRQEFARAGDLSDWQQIVEGTAPQDDPAALVVRHEEGGLVFATVFGQLLESSPGALRLSSSRQPWQAGTWTNRSWQQ